MTLTDTYEGWTNRETWAVALWINNEQAMQEQVHEAVTDLRDDEGESLIVKVAWTTEQVTQAANVVQQYVSDLFDVDNYGGSLPGALLTMREDIGSMWRVDWREIGAAFLRDVSSDDPQRGPCDACSADAGEPCRWDCTARPDGAPSA